MSQRFRLAGLVICAAGCLAPPAAFSHAAMIEAETAQAIRLHAHFDNGAPMSHAQVVIYAPQDPTVPWGQGVTDRDGRLEFVLGPEVGRWSFQVRQAGHGAIAHIHIDDTGTTVSALGNTQGWGQRIVMVALVAWGAIGTAAFALSRKRSPDASA